MVVIWLRFRSCHKANGSMQLAALIVCIAILLPVISISDDLMAVQFTAETDTSLRWGHRPSINHAVPHHAPVLLHAPFAGLSSAPLAKPATEVSHLAFILTQASIRLLNRPPPAL